MERGFATFVRLYPIYFLFQTFAFSFVFRYNRYMVRLSILVILLAVYFSPFSLFAEEGYIGENPGLNFYSRIDETAGDIAN